MSIFRSLFSKRPELPEPGQVARAYLERLGITRQQALAMRDLKDEPGWTALLTALDNLISLRGEEMLRIDDSNTLHFYRGRLTGLRDVPALVDEILNNLEKAEETDARTKQRDHLADDPEHVATYGTPAWAEPGAWR